MINKCTGIENERGAHDRIRNQGDAHARWMLSRIRNPARDNSKVIGKKVFRGG